MRVVSAAPCCRASLRCSMIIARSVGPCSGRTPTVAACAALSTGLSIGTPPMVACAGRADQYAAGPALPALHRHLEGPGHPGRRPERHAASPVKSASLRSPAAGITPASPAADLPERPPSSPSGPSRGGSLRRERMRDSWSLLRSAPPACLVLTHRPGRRPPHAGRPWLGRLFPPRGPRLRDLFQYLRCHRLGPGMHGQIAQRHHADQLLAAVEDR